MTNFSDFDAVKAKLDSVGGVMTLPMSELRDANGSGRLGPYVVEAIHKQLASKGMGHFPEELPQNQWEKVRIFGLGSQISDLYLLLSDLSEESDEKIREYGSNDAKEKLDRIRQIVC